MRLSKAFIVDLIWLLLNSRVEKLAFKVVFEMLLGLWCLKKFSWSPVKHSQFLTSNAHKIFGLQDQRKETSCRASTLQMPCRETYYWPSQQMMNRCIQETLRVGTEKLACPFHISVSNSWATAESRNKISRGRQGVCSMHTKMKCTM